MLAKSYRFSPLIPWRCEVHHTQVNPPGCWWCGVVVHSWIPLTDSLLRIFALRAFREVPSYVSIPWCCLHLTLVMGLGPLRKMNKVTSVSFCALARFGGGKLRQPPGPGAFGGRRRFLTTLPSSVMLNSLTTRAGGGGQDLGGGRSGSPAPQRDDPWPLVGSVCVPSHFSCV